MNLRETLYLTSITSAVTRNAAVVLYDKVGFKVRDLILKAEAGKFSVES